MDYSNSKITGEVRIVPAILQKLQKRAKNIPVFKKIIEDYSTKNITELSEVLFGGAILLGASDIHIEPEEDQANIRLRIDGILQNVTSFNFKTYKTLLSRIKLLSGIKLNIADRPQDGRFSIVMVFGKGRKEELIEVRASTLPAEYGESVVLRILNPKNLIMIEALGLRSDLFKLFIKEIRQPNGMIIVTGPTGSGKTTTLYAFLKKIRKPEIKIITIEDPIEYHLEGISQTQVAPKKKYDFASGLRSIVRQDPDVILVGEVRDLETAQIALQAALTGHLVLTTLHTNDAAGTIARLQALGEKPVNIAPAISLAIAQRLVRKVCKKCVKSITIPSDVFLKMKSELKKLPKGVKIPVLKPGLKIPKNNGCKACNSTGYRGRIGIFEAFLVGDKMEKFIMSSPSIAALRKKATEEGMLTIRQDGLIKILEGTTTLEEVDRVTGE